MGCMFNVNEFENNKKKTASFQNAENVLNPAMDSKRLTDVSACHEQQQLANKKRRQFFNMDFTVLKQFFLMMHASNHNMYNGSQFESRKKEPQSPKIIHTLSGAIMNALFQTSCKIGFWPTRSCAFSISKRANSDGFSKNSVYTN